MTINISHNLMVDPSRQALRSIACASPCTWACACTPPHGHLAPTRSEEGQDSSLHSLPGHTCSSLLHEESLPCCGPLESRVSLWHGKGSECHRWLSTASASMGWPGRRKQSLGIIPTPSSPAQWLQVANVFGGISRNSEGAGLRVIYNCF